MVKQSNKYTLMFEFTDGTIKKYTTLQIRGIRHKGQRPINAFLKYNHSKESFIKDDYIKRAVYTEIPYAMHPRHYKSILLKPDWFKEAMAMKDNNE